MSRKPKTIPARKKPARKGIARDPELPQGCRPAEKLAAFEALAAAHGIKPIQDPKTMVAKFWPTDETADDIVAAVRALRRQE